MWIDTARKSSNVNKINCYLTDLSGFLDQHATYFSSLINITSLLPHLLSMNLLTRHEEEYLENHHITDAEKILKLLFYVKGKGPKGIQRFLKAIKEETTHLGHTELDEILTQRLDEYVKCHKLSMMITTPNQSKHSPIAYYFVTMFEKARHVG